MSGDWVMKPELSKAHLNIEDRDLEYEKKIQLQDHIVYLSKTSGIRFENLIIKLQDGLTREQLKQLS